MRSLKGSGSGDEAAVLTGERLGRRVPRVGRYGSVTARANQPRPAGGRGFGFDDRRAADFPFFLTLNRAGAPAGFARVPLPRPSGPRRVGLSPGVPGCGLSPGFLL